MAAVVAWSRKQSARHVICVQLEVDFQKFRFRLTEKV